MVRDDVLAAHRSLSIRPGARPDSTSFRACGVQLKIVSLDLRDRSGDGSGAFPADSSRSRNAVVEKNHETSNAGASRGNDREDERKGANLSLRYAKPSTRTSWTNVTAKIGNPVSNVLTREGVDARRGIRSCRDPGVCRVLALL